VNKMAVPRNLDIIILAEWENGNCPTPTVINNFPQQFLIISMTE